MASSIQITLDAADWQKQVSAAIKTLDQFTVGLDAERKKMLEYAAIPLVDELQRRAPVGVRIHTSYKSRKSGGGAQGKYYPGNLKKSFRTLDLRKTSAVIVGAKLTKGGRGTFGLGRFNAYYLHWVEYGTAKMAARPFVRPAIISAAPAAVRRITNAARLYAEKFAAKNAKP